MKDGYEVTDSGIYQIISVDDNNIRTCRMIMPRGVFVEAFNHYIKDNYYEQSDGCCFGVREVKA